MKRVAVVLGLAISLVSGGAMRGEVKVYEKKITMPAWETGAPQVHSEFWDSGTGIYPYTLNETLTNNKVEKTYTGVFLENEYIQVLVLPEIGGRLHGALDKTNNYTWLYWQKTIKPGLISMTGAWISGGIEWNFPHGHRPSGFMPVDHRIVHNDDGSATVWVGETEPMFRMRWLVGMTIFPGKSYVRCDYVFINPTSQRNSFMFWATAATPANEHAQAQYPGDVVTGHGKHEFWNWPIHEGVDLTWWKNVPNASSFFAVNNPSEWFGAYDHQAQGGTVHYANVHEMPGKKLWTWGSGPSGRIWEDILSEGGGAYFEPQAGAFSDNQPDYHWMAPNEVKTTHDYWYPVRDIRGFRNANRDFAVNVDLQDGKAFAGVYATGVAENRRVVLKNAVTGATLSEKTVTVAPDRPFTVEAKVGAKVSVYDLRLSVYDPDGRLEIELQRKPPQKIELPEGQESPGDPKKMDQDELYHSGEWLDRFRETEKARVYYDEALAKDSGDSRVNVEMGFLALKQGRSKEALDHLNTALKRDADNSRIYYGKGLALKALGEYEAAYEEFYRATYTYDYFAASHYNLALLDMQNGDYGGALEKLTEAESQNGKFADIQAVKAAAYRHLREPAKALQAAERALQLDPMHFMGGRERRLALQGAEAGEWARAWEGYMRGAVQNYLELAVAYAGAGLYEDGDAVLAGFSEGTPETSLNPMVNYFRGYFKHLAGDQSAAAGYFARAKQGPAPYTNPHRLEARSALEAAIAADPSDAHAHLFLGNLVYAKGQRELGFSHWQKAVALDAGLAEAQRNVAYGERYFRQDMKGSLGAYRKAVSLAPKDARLLKEFDEVAEAVGVSSAERLARFEERIDVVNARDDLIARLIDLRLELGGDERLAATYDVLSSHHFHTWEGKYGIHNAWVEVNQQLGDAALKKKDFAAALGYYQKAAEYPGNLEVAPRTPDFRAHVNWNLARVNEAMGKADAASGYLRKVTAEKYGKAHLGTYYQALAYKALGKQEEYQALLGELETEARKRTSGEFRYRGTPETVGHYLLALVLAEKGDEAAAAKDRKLALQGNRHANRLALLEAQIDIAGAHQ